MVEFLKGQVEDFEEIVDFANYVFSHAAGKIDFPSLLPKLYKKEYNTTNNHYIVKEEGKIKAVIGAFPMDIEVMDETLRVKGIGTVSVHPYSRGKDYMKKLMYMILEDMEKEEVDFSLLGGLRQRYEHFSYTPAGEKITFNISSSNIRYKFGKEIDESITFKIIEKDDKDLIEKAYELYNENEIKVIREKSKFLDIAKSWGCKVYAILKKDEFVGYMSISGTSIAEIYMYSYDEILKVIATYIQKYKISGVNLSTAMYEHKKIKKFKEICEGYSIGTVCNFNIINYENVVRAFLKVKSSYSKLIDGCIKVQIKDYGTLKINVDNNNVKVKRIEENGDIVLEKLKATEFFFSPMPRINNEENKNLCINSWFPLPLYFTNEDNV